MSIQDIFEEGDTGEAILPVPVSAIAARARANSSTPVEVDKVSDKSVHADRDGSEAREARLAPRGDNPSTSLPTARDAESSVPGLKEIRTEWGVMFNDGSVLLEYNGRTAQRRAAAAAEKIAARYYPDNIRLVSRPVYAGEWVES